MRRLLNLLSKVNQRICRTNSKLYIGYLRKKGVLIGKGTEFFGLVFIDVTRPCLVEIGRNCVFASGVQLLTHGYDWAVLREKYGEVLSSSGKVVIEDNVFLGSNTIILKGVRIGRNTIIGAGSVVTHNISPNSVAVGNPCKVIMGLDEYYEKRKIEHVEEAKDYALEIYRKTGKIPRKEDFWEEFPIFLNRDPSEWGKLPVRRILGTTLENFIRTKPLFKSFEEFLLEAGIPPEKLGNVKRKRPRK
jgi:acetyltransferase-like isoleucine patch superfamily enzyme